jgi:hypothetical protein
MDSHENARPTPRGLLLMVERLLSGWSVSEGAAAGGVTCKTVRKWRDRFAVEGEAGLRDLSARPLRSPGRLPAVTVKQIEALRRQRRSGPAMARHVGVPVSTVGLVLRRLGLGRLRALDPRPQVIRYQREHPGELIHLDIMKLGRIDGIGHRITGDRTGQSSKRGTGWEYLHVAIDDASRLAFTAILADEKKESATAFLVQALDWFRAHGVVQRVMTDSGSGLHKPPVRRCPRRPGDATQAHPALYAQDQRQSRTLHPNQHPCMGLRQPLRLIGTANPSHAPLAAH